MSVLPAWQGTPVLRGKDSVLCAGMAALELASPSKAPEITLRVPVHLSGQGS